MNTLLFTELSQVIEVKGIKEVREVKEVKAISFMASNLPLKLLAITSNDHGE